MEFEVTHLIIIISEPVLINLFTLFNLSLASRKDCDFTYIRKELFSFFWRARALGVNAVDMKPHQGNTSTNVNIHTNQIGRKFQLKYKNLSNTELLSI